MPVNELDPSVLEKYWPQIKTKVLIHWNKLSEKDVERTHGRQDSLEELVESVYGSNARFEDDYERICTPFTDRAKSVLYGGKTPVEKDLQRMTAADGFNEPDDEDEEGMTRFDDTNADYSGLAMSEAEQEKLLKPDLKGMDASEAQTTPFSSTQKIEANKQNSHNTKPDVFKPNQDPLSSQTEDITVGRSNSSANTTSSSALLSSGVKKL